MYSLGLLIVELEIARKRLLYAFEVPDGTTKVNFARSQFPTGRAAELASHLAHSHTPRLCGSHEPRPA
jgi:hypothetical protein